MDKIDIIRKHINSDDFYDLNGTEMLKYILNAMDEFAEQQVKLFAISDVSNSMSKKGTGQYMIFITLIIVILDVITYFTLLRNTDVILIINSLVLIMLVSSIRFNQ